MLPESSYVIIERLLQIVIWQQPFSLFYSSECFMEVSQLSTSYTYWKGFKLTVLEMISSEHTEVRKSFMASLNIFSVSK